MFNTVAVYLDKNSSLWATKKPVADALTDLKAGIASIALKSGRQATPTSGSADEKTQIRADLEDKTLEVADEISAFAAASNDVALAAQVNLTRSTVQKLSAEDLEKAAKRISATAAANLTALSDYDVNQADLTELEALTTEFDAAKSGPRSAIVDRAAETATLPEVITQTTDILRDRLDKLMTKFRKTNPEFYAGYQSARVVVNRSGQSNAPTPPTPPAKPTP